MSGPDDNDRDGLERERRGQSEVQPSEREELSDGAQHRRKPDDHKEPK